FFRVKSNFFRVKSNFFRVVSTDKDNNNKQRYFTFAVTLFILVTVTRHLLLYQKTVDQILLI
ncbi:hypothetical protein, partial [Providencia alcalifaciens]|uniref:hypothetical protein n=1 Tax=Providencia alcalifaciens TaxID=126385 RepID=UPI00055B00DA